MDKPFKLLIAIDASKYASEVLEQLSKRQWKDGTEILIVTAIEPDHIWEASAQYMHQCQVILNDYVCKLQHLMPNCKFSCECMEGSATNKIVELAREWQADLIVIGSHGDTGIRPDRVGSVAASVVNNAPCSVEVIKVYERTAGQKKESVSPEVSPV